jgi:hypothetical protein
LFDFDYSNSLNITELTLFLSSSINGLCKLAHASIPSFSDIKQLASKGYCIIDENKDGAITFDEFWDWIETDEEIQEYYLYHMAYLTKENAIIRYASLINMQLKCFQNAIADSKGNEEPITLYSISIQGDNIEKLEVYDYIAIC